ncbi:hypothetical protein D0B54_23605 [Solimonas sp. K1W22B-7]|uniref:hypothetical protein n=1 Tax=Solimonas sp. K1W22B-7 TaxID=2303331 RepID=UPI000E32DA07|nr:hypothetical protein [Solimonas sp. K1W22B-7]AXQ31486.1 hypothetical protein D0B54_23605 [Solimonas sp. K1W22B-7]
MLEGLLLLAAAALPPGKPAAPSAELLEFLAEWPDEGVQRLLDEPQAEAGDKKDRDEKMDKRDAKAR